VKHPHNFFAIYLKFSSVLLGSKTKITIVKATKKVNRKPIQDILSTKKRILYDFKKKDHRITIPEDTMIGIKKSFRKQSVIPCLFRKYRIVPKPNARLNEKANATKDILPVYNAKNTPIERNMISVRYTLLTSSNLPKLYVKVFKFENKGRKAAYTAK